MYILNRPIVLSIAIIVVISITGMLSGCDSFHRNKMYANVSNASIKKGKALAALYCQSCHSLPDPALVDAKNWDQGVLPQMGPRLGVFRHGLRSYPYNRHDPTLRSNFYPAAPVITSEQWQNIIDYYTATSPDSLPE